jgi:DNA uptake protein ComE-like DNA-binding protein
LGLRDNSWNITSRTIYFNNVQPAVAFGTATPATPVQASATVFSSAPQPVISEVYVNQASEVTTDGQNPAGYVAVELYNPYNFALTMVNWQLAYINRSGSGATNPQFPNMQFIPIGQLGSIGNPVTIPAYGYVLLENYNPFPGSATTKPTVTDANSATYRPRDLNAAGATDIYVPYLETVINGTTADPALQALAGFGYTATAPGGELVILRPRRADGTFSTSADPRAYTEGAPPSLATPYTADYWEMVPIDSYDFSGMTLATAAPYNVYSYVRPKGPGLAFCATYPGAYNQINLVRQFPTGFVKILTQSTAVSGPLTFTPPAPTEFGMGSAPTAAYYPTNAFGPVQVYNLGPPPAPLNALAGHFPNFMLGTTGGSSTADLPVTSEKYPFGAFARNGDLLDIPYIGAYCIRPLSTTVPSFAFIEINSLPMDCFLASTDYTPGPPNVNQFENIGRFVPMASAIGSSVLPVTMPDYQAWASRLFDNLTVQGNDAFLPNFDPGLNDVNNQLAPNNIFKYPYPAPAPALPSPVNTLDAAALDHTGQDQSGVEGLININTANWKVLSMLPMVPSNVAGYVGKNQTLAKAIVDYRIQHGPFLSIFDLNNVPGFQQATNGGAAGTTPVAPTNATGMISPADPNFPNVDPTKAPSTTASGIGLDYQYTMNTMNRISNLITTRSDTFTVYVELQGWQNVPPPASPGATAGSTQWYNYSTVPPPQPVVTRHFAFIVDRSGVTADPNTRSVKTVPVPND